MPSGNTVKHGWILLLFVSLYITKRSEDVDIWLKTNLKAHYFISNQYWKRNYELVKEMMSQKGQWKLCVQMSSHYLGNNRKLQ